MGQFDFPPRPKKARPEEDALETSLENSAGEAEIGPATEEEIAEDKHMLAMLRRQRMDEIKAELMSQQTPPERRAELMIELEALQLEEKKEEEEKKGEKIEGEEGEEIDVALLDDDDDAELSAAQSVLALVLAQHLRDAEKVDSLHEEMGISAGQKEEVRRGLDFFQMFSELKTMQRFVLPTEGGGTRAIDIRPGAQRVVIREYAMPDGQGGRLWEITSMGGVKESAYTGEYSVLEAEVVQEGVQAIKGLDELFRALMEQIRRRVRPDMVRSANDL